MPSEMNGSERNGKDRVQGIPLVQQPQSRGPRPLFPGDVIHHADPFPKNRQYNHPSVLSLSRLGRGGGISERVCVGRMERGGQELLMKLFFTHESLSPPSTRVEGGGNRTATLSLYVWDL